MKTTGMSQQLEALRRMEGKDGYALFMEQGTGKTWTLLADAEREFESNIISALVVIAPKGVHVNWIRREIPAHLSVPVIGRVWRSGMGKGKRKAMDDLFKWNSPDGTKTLRVLTMNFDALLTKDGFAFVEKFLKTYASHLDIDESSRIKTPTASRTIACMRLRPLARRRRIATGTPITKQPADVFPQMEFLEEGTLGTTSYRAFVAEYADLVPMKQAAETQKKLRAGLPCTPVELAALNSVDWAMKKRMERDPRLAYAQIPRRDEKGRPVWRNLEKLKALLEPHSYRVLKRDCLDLPEKIYKTHYFSLSPAQEKAYGLMEEELRIELMSGEVEPVHALAALVKLQQITSGFVVPRDRIPFYVGEDNPRLAALVDLLEDIEGKVLIWARFTEEIRAIRETLKEKGYEVVEYHGAVKDADREAAVDAIQTGTARIFLGQAQAGGIGLTLTAAETSIYYSNDFNRETRAQSEDRNHRIGTKNNVVYIDLVAEDTIDESIARSHQAKADMAAEILGDRKLDVIGVIDDDAAIIDF